MQGDSTVPVDASEEVDFHYACFIKTTDSQIYEMDGDRKGPINKGVKLGNEDDMLSKASIDVVKGYFKQNSSENINIMALVETKFWG